MLTKLIVCLCLGASVYAATLVDTKSNATTSSSPYNIEEELNKIATTCVTDRDYKQLAGNVLNSYYAELFNRHLIKEAEKTIGLTEMRAALGFSPPGPWKEFVLPSESQLSAASTIEEYFDLKEPISVPQTTDNDYFYEHQFPPVIAFLDERIPSIRNIFKQEFKKIVRKNVGEAIDRKTVDHIIDEYLHNILLREARKNAKGIKVSRPEMVKPVPN